MFPLLAAQYKMDGGSPIELCLHNQRVARDNSLPGVAFVCAVVLRGVIRWKVRLCGLQHWNFLEHLWRIHLDNQADIALYVLCCPFFCVCLLL